MAPHTCAEACAARSPRQVKGRARQAVTSQTDARGERPHRCLVGRCGSSEAVREEEEAKARRLLAQARLRLECLPWAPGAI